MERPSGESGGPGTRGGSEGQVEHPDGDGYGTRGPDDPHGSLVSVHEKHQVGSKGWFRKFLGGWFNSEVKNTFLKCLE